MATKDSTPPLLEMSFTASGGLYCLSPTATEGNIHNQNTRDIETPAHNADNRRTGGLAAMLALSRMKTIADETGSSVADYFEQQDCAINVMVGAAEQLSPFMEGFVATLSEYIHNVNMGGTPCIVQWKSKAAKTEAEIAFDRSSLEEHAREGNKVCHA